MAADAARRRGARASRSRSTRPAAAAPGPTRTPSRRASPTSCRARRSSSSSGDARRSASSSARRAPPEGIDLKPIAARVRTDGPLLPPLSLALARWIADHYLAPPAIVIRAMLPPGLLERLDLVAERRPGAPPSDLAAADRDLLEQLDRGPRAVRDLVAPEGRAGPDPAARGARGERAR